MEFFLRKGIGWAYGNAPEPTRGVIRYVRSHEAELSGFSKREALKYLASYSSKLR
jgi:hypothetical protein